MVILHRDDDDEHTLYPLTNGQIVRTWDVAHGHDPGQFIRRESIMKKILLFTLIAGVMFVSSGCSPSYRTQQGALIGAALGAWAGQDLGHDTESTLIGAAVGGVAGAVIGDAVQTYEQENVYQYNYAPYQTQNSPQRRR